MAIKITTLSENTASMAGILAEWGLSFFIEADGKKILLDAGAGISAANNAEKLGIDLASIDKIVLSHGHYDHTGGLMQILSLINHEVEIIAHPDIWADKYGIGPGKPERYIGIPYSKEELEDLGARFTLTSKSVQISENIFTTGEVPMTTDFETIESSLFVKTGSGFEPDKLADDQALVIKDPLGLIVVLGCAHRGMINTLYHARQIAGVQKIYMVIGGCHLYNDSDEKIWQTISSLNELGVKKLAVSHCTGNHATVILAQTFGHDFIFNNAGNIINLP